MTPADALLRVRVLEHAPDLSADDRAAVAFLRQLAEAVPQPEPLSELLGARQAMRLSYELLLGRVRDDRTARLTVALVALLEPVGHALKVPVPDTLAVSIGRHLNTPDLMAVIAGLVPR